MLKLVLGLFLLAAPAMALVKYDDKTHTLEVSGNTTSLQVVRAMNFMNQYDVLVVRMWGRGGDFYAGLALGRRIRDEGAAVVIPKGADCISSCANAALGGLKTVIDGSLLFHSPFLGRMSVIETPMQFAAKSGLGYVDNVAYLIDMGYPVSFMRLLLSDTTHCKFVKFDSTKDLEAMKGNPLDRIRGVQHVDWCYQLKR